MILALLLLLATSKDVALQTLATSKDVALQTHRDVALQTHRDVALQTHRDVALQGNNNVAPQKGSATTSVVATLDGRAVDPLADDARATVLVFIHPDCPVSNRYAPELNRLHGEYASRGIHLFAVYPGRDDDDAAIREHYKEFGLRVPALRDPDFRLADLAGATMTPEAAVFAPGRRLVYRGRIDDRAPRLGVWRPVARERNLADVLNRLGKGETVQFHTTQAVGCYIKPIS